MSQFLRLLTEEDKATALQIVCTRWRQGKADLRHFDVSPDVFDAVPGKPFAYWVSDQLRSTFKDFPPFESNGRTAKVGLQTSDNFRFLRIYWEVVGDSTNGRWYPYAKGGGFSPYYADLYLVFLWDSEGKEVKAWASSLYNNSHWSRILKNVEFLFRPGITWSTRTTSGLSVRALPSGCGFDTKGCAAFCESDQNLDILALLAITNSAAFKQLVAIQLAAADAAARSYDTGVFNRTPLPLLTTSLSQELALLSLRAWSLKRTLDTIAETSHAFILPAALRTRLGDFNPSAIEAELARIQTKIDDIAFDLYGFSEIDRTAVRNSQNSTNQSEAGTSTEEEDEESNAAPVNEAADLFSWACGVVFGRFDWRLAIGERAVTFEPTPFAPLPAKSAGMLPDGAEPFHANAGILVDDPGHPHDLPRLVEKVLARLDVVMSDDIRRWFQRDFFAFHLQRYSKSRRKAPIYWPLSTTSGSYALWIYYPRLTSQTLYTVINDFIEPKLKQVSADVTTLRNKGTARSRDDEKQFEAKISFELELTELHDTLLKLAPTYKPNHNDGVQINAAPLWPLFRHKPWQKMLKDTWAKLEKGDYDWAHLAMSYWPDRVREKCKTDKSLAIAHGLEHLYIEPEAQPKKTRGRKKVGGDK